MNLAVLLGLVGCQASPQASSAPISARLTARTAGAPAIGFQTMGAQKLYPLTPGLRWDYVLRQQQASGPTERQMAMGVLSAERIDDSDEIRAELGRRYHGMAMPATRARAFADRVVLSRQFDSLDGPSLTIIQTPAEAGRSWDGRPFTNGVNENVVVRGAETVVVPAGSFEAIHIDHELRYPNGDGDVLSYWYAPGAGCVRMIERTTIVMNGQTMKLEVDGLLTALTPNAWPPSEPAKLTKPEGVVPRIAIGL